MLTNRLLRRTAHASSRGGFTLVELLVVIGIIAILAGVALGPITNGIKKAKQSSAMQSAHSIGLAMYSYANDNTQLYPDKTGGTADDVAAALLAGGYVTDASIFYISSDTVATKIATTNNTALTIAGSGVTCWDFLANGGNGVSSVSYPWLPLLWTSVNGGTEPNVTATNPNPIVATPVAGNAFNADGMAVFYINNAAAFITASLNGAAITCTVVTGTNNLNAGSVPATYVPLKGK